MPLTVILIIISIISFPSSTLFHSRLKTFLFCKSFPLQPFFFFFRTDYMDSSDFYCYFQWRIQGVSRHPPFCLGALFEKNIF